MFKLLSRGAEQIDQELPNMTAKPSLPSRLWNTVVQSPWALASSTLGPSSSVRPSTVGPSSSVRPSTVGPSSSVRPPTEPLPSSSQSGRMEPSPALL